jgi:hypothetical protein
MRSAITTLLMAAAVALHTGCAPSWKIAGATERSFGGGYTVCPPRQWMVFKVQDRMVLSRHGIALDNIYLSRKKLNDPFKNTHMSYDSSMIPHEITEVTASDLATTPGISGVQLLEMSPQKVDDIDATKVLIRYSTDEYNIEKTALVYMMLIGKWYYEISFSAVGRHYFDAGVKDFESLVKSINFSKSVKKDAAPVKK